MLDTYSVGPGEHAQHRDGHDREDSPQPVRPSGGDVYRCIRRIGIESVVAGDHLVAL